MRLPALLIRCLLLCGILLAVFPPQRLAAQSVSEAEMRAAQVKSEDLTPADRARILEMLGSQAESNTASTDSVTSGFQLSDFEDSFAPRPLGRELVPAEPDAEARQEDEELPLLGRAIFEMSPEGFEPASYGPVPEDYAIGPGDELIIEVWGEVSFRDVYRVDRRGSVLLRDAGQVTVVGLDLDKAHREIRRKLARVYSGVKTDGGGSTQVDVSLGRLRAIRVFVIGEAQRPGGYEVSSVATVSQLLYAAGGPSEIGSMRDIRLIRDNRVIGSLDLYRYLLEGMREGDKLLREGDTVFIPVAGTVVSVRGPVRRSRRLELTEEEGLRDAIRYSGGLTPSARTDIAVVRRILPTDQRSDGGVDRVDLDAPLTGILNENAPLIELEDGDEVRVLDINPRAESYVSVTGSVVLPGRYGFEPGMRVGDLLRKAKGPWRDALLERALLVRVRDDYTRESFPISLIAVAGDPGADLHLAPMDSLIVFSRSILREELEVRIMGEVRRPGAYDYYEGMTLRDLILEAGGTTEAAEMSQAEVSRLDPVMVAGDNRLASIQEVSLVGSVGESDADRFLLENHDNVFIRMLPGWELQRNVDVRGEVLYPGIYTLLSRDERLSSVIQRAGGLLETAYPAGFRVVRQYNGIGNIGLDLEKALSEPGSVHDIVMDAGDLITVPQLIMSVQVRGEVGFPTSVIFEKGKSIGHYVKHAGDYTSRSDKNQTRIIYPNGLSAKVKKFWWDPHVETGSTIVVPTKDPTQRINWGEVIIGTTSVIASLATVYLVIWTTQN